MLEVTVVVVVLLQQAAAKAVKAGEAEVEAEATRKAE